MSKLSTCVRVLRDEGIGSLVKETVKYTFRETPIRIPLAYLHWLLEDVHKDYEYDNYRRKYNIDPSFRFNGPEITFYGEGEISIDADSYIGRNSNISVRPNTAVSIGENCSISHYVTIYTGNRIANQDMSTAPINSETGNVDIESHVWIGFGAFITHNTTIGENAVVGAHSTVVQDIPPHSIAVGSPANVITFKEYVTREKAQQLAKGYEPALSDNVKQQYLV